MGDQSSVPSVAPAKNPLDCIAHFAGEAAANTRAHLARLLHLPPLRHSPQTAGDNHTPRLLDRHDAHALAGTSGQKSAATQMDLHDSFSSAGGRSGFQGLPAGAQHSAGNSAVSGKAMGVTPQAALEHPGSAAVGGELAAREELGRATWTLLHTLAAQFPDRPSRQQQKDARSLVSPSNHFCTAQVHHAAASSVEYVCMGKCYAAG